MGKGLTHLFPHIFIINIFQCSSQKHDGAVQILCAQVSRHDGGDDIPVLRLQIKGLPEGFQGCRIIFTRQGRLACFE